MIICFLIQFTVLWTLEIFCHCRNKELKSWRAESKQKQQRRHGHPGLQSGWVQCGPKCRDLEDQETNQESGNGQGVSPFWMLVDFYIWVLDLWQFWNVWLIWIYIIFCVYLLLIDDHCLFLLLWIYVQLHNWYDYLYLE